MRLKNLDLLELDDNLVSQTFALSPDSFDMPEKASKVAES